ncbi:serine/threonine-protein phosphatase [Sulfurimonas sp. NW15]|uniref:PP2C family protein-serine/threonine phosphatase n=1 Tax=Sulfurimonas sp. NW15 TaxID=2922729 RepID=UPI003DA804FE
MQEKSTDKSLQEEKDAYAAYQEELAFQKELNILRNDFYYKMIDSKDISLVDFFYQPLDTLSGDAYSARRINEDKTFYFLVDGMGKGLSASLSAMAVTVFVNHLIDKMIEYENFSLDILIQESMDFMKPILLDEEALSVDYILFDNYSFELEYAKFAMPPFLLEDNAGNVIKIKSNNPPMSKWSETYKIDNCSVKNIHKFLFYSDGIVENNTVEGIVYNSFIENDFIDSFTREEMKKHVLEKIAIQEDDFTFIFINRLELNETTLISAKVFETTLDAVEEANNWYDGICRNHCSGLAFNELFMNAYEHGNLGIDSEIKHQLLEQDKYFETLVSLEKECTKKITVKIYNIKTASAQYRVTQITDEGEGFDTNQLATIFRNSKKFNGRGVFVSRKNSMGIYYNSKGNSVLFLTKV